MAKTTKASEPPGEGKTVRQRTLDGIEWVGGNMPHSAILLFLGLIGMWCVVASFIGGVVPAGALFAPIFAWYVFDIPVGLGAPVRG
jgi:p-aminobenzoyl-glutamate transporter AbgT